MAERTGIEWTDATVNFWWGCTKVGPGCENCYAETWSKRFRAEVWGAGVPRRKIKSAVALLYRLHNDYSWWAADHYIADRHPTPHRRVFIQSMSDLFDLDVPLEWFAEAWKAITACDRLYVQIVTKRVSVIEKRLAEIGATWPAHAGLIITVTSQGEADRDIPRLLALMTAFNIPWIGLSCEPLLAPIVLPEPFLNLGRRAWVIVGGESGAKARPMHPDWVRWIRDQCDAAEVPFHFKQWGEFDLSYDRDKSDPDWSRCGEMQRHPGRWINLKGGHGFHGERVHYARKVGKRAAGRTLDGITHAAFPDFLPGRPTNATQVQA